MTNNPSFVGGNALIGTAFDKSWRTYVSSAQLKREVASSRHRMADGSYRYVYPTSNTLRTYDVVMDGMPIDQLDRFYIYRETRQKLLFVPPLAAVSNALTYNQSLFFNDQFTPTLQAQTFSDGQITVGYGSIIEPSSISLKVPAYIGVSCNFSLWLRTTPVSQWEIPANASLGLITLNGGSASNYGSSNTALNTLTRMSVKLPGSMVTRNYIQITLASQITRVAGCQLSWGSENLLPFTTGRSIENGVISDIDESETTVQGEILSGVRFSIEENRV